MKKQVSFLCRIGLAVAAAAALFITPASASEVVPPNEVVLPNETVITIIHTNDVHARVSVEPYVAALAKSKKQNGENVLVLSAGDAFHGQPLATLSKGLNIVSIMNAAGYDAMVPGNHDFNYGYERLWLLSRKTAFPIISANVIDAKTERPLFAPYVIKDLGGAKVGIFGLSTPETATKTNPLNVKDLRFENPAETAKKTVKELKDKKCDVIIALAHLGVDSKTKKSERSTAVAGNGIDVIIDGHSHTQTGKTVAGTLIAQTGEYGENIGIVTLKVKDGKVTESDSELLPIEGTEIIPDNNVTELIDKINKDLEKYTSQVVAETKVSLNGERENVRTSETNLGDLIADAMRHESKAVFAVENGGGIRVSIPAGKVTKGDIVTVLPFGNYIVTKQLTGAEVKAVLENGVSSYPEPAGGFPQVSGFSFTFDPSAKAGNRVTSITPDSDGSPGGSEKFDDEAVYTVAVNDFYAAGGDGNTVIKEAAGDVIFGALDEALISYMQTKPQISDKPAGRIIAAVKSEKGV